MKQQLAALSLGIGALLFATQFAFAQSARNCGERQAVVDRLAERYGESRQSIGIGANNSVLVLDEVTPFVNVLIMGDV
ncbi:MAG: hypothetical protein ACC631_04575, partial [Halocynthiibacter sp.]